MTTRPYQKQRLPVDSISWTPVTLPFNCQRVVLRNDTTDTKIRTDSTDPTTEDTFVAGVQEDIPLNGIKATHVGSVIAYLQSSGGSPTVIVTFISGWNL